MINIKMEKQFEDLEIWDYPPNYERLYQVSSKGRVWGIKINRFLKPVIDSYGYYVISLSKDGKRKAHKVHRLVALTFYFVDDDDYNKQIDHIDRNKTNNNLLNLRFCTRAQNKRNQGIQKNNRSGCKGITYEPSNKWRARICTDKQKKHLGIFDTKEEAYNAYKQASQELHGDFSYTPNYPDSPLMWSSPETNEGF